MQVLSSLKEISSKDWDQFANPTDLEDSSSGLKNSYNPFLSHKFLSSLEDSNCATQETGWMAQHLVLSRIEDSKEPEMCGIIPVI